MSFKALSWAWEANTITAGRKLVLVGLAQFANEKHECWPSQKTLAERTMQSERTVREHLAWLEAEQFIARQSRVTETRFDSDVIRLNIERLEPVTLAEARRLEQENIERKPAADFAAGKDGASGEKPQEPAADFAESQRQISPPNLHMNLQQESPITPQPPKGGEGSGKKRKESVKPDQFDHLIPLQLQAAEFVDAWHSWVEHRNEIRKPITERAAKLALEDLARDAVNPNVAVAWIRKAIKSRWQGIYADQRPAQRQDAPTARSGADAAFLAQLEARGARPC